jgi:hypothetical protein
MPSRLRFVLGLILLVISIALLMWGFLPLGQETRIQSITPDDLVVPAQTMTYAHIALALHVSFSQPITAL